MKNTITFKEALRIAQEVFEELQSKYRSENNFGDKTDSEINKILSELLSDLNKK